MAHNRRVELYALDALEAKEASYMGEPAMRPPERWAEPQWEEVASGIRCKLLATGTCVLISSTRDALI